MKKKKKTNTIYKFTPVIYPFPLLVARASDVDVDALVERFATVTFAGDVEAATRDDFTAEDDATARTMMLIDRTTGKEYFLVLIFSPESVGAGIAAHEALHVTVRYFRYIGFDPCTTANEEAYAYFVQWVTSCMWSVLVDETEKLNGVVLDE